MAYPAADAAVALTAMYLVARDKRVLSSQLASPFSHIASALLVILATSHFSGHKRTLNQVASFALPLLGAHPSGYALFQLANAFGIYRLLCSNVGLLQGSLGVLLYLCLVLANLNLSNQTQLKTIMQDVSFAQVRYYNALQKLRELTLDDLWPVPERFQLRNAYAELTINTNESLFLIRAIIRMVWKPMIPIHVAATVLPIYHQVGWYAFIPLLVSSSVNMFDWAFKRLMGSAYDWDPSCGFYQGDTIESIYFSIKTVKMFGWERMYTDPKIRRPLESFKNLPWYAPAVLFVFRAIRFATRLTTDLSMYITVVMYLKTMSSTEYAMTNSQLLEMTEHISTMRWNVVRIAWQMGKVTKLIKDATSLEHLFRGETFNTISHVGLGESDIVPSITMDNCGFRWKKNPSILKEVTINVTAGELVALVGKTGSGKTSLLLAMCRELEMTKGIGAVVGRIGYMEQSPWIMNDTMRANILFGREFNEEYYWKVIHACALTRDLESWPDSDMTMIGERGVNISGGQRARLALARTVYSQADVYILDDPLSAVDAHVKRHILDNVILSSGLLGNKLRIITTHSESMLPFCNQVITVGDKTTSVVYQEPKEHQYIASVAAVEIDDVCKSNSTETDTDSSTIALTTDADPQATTSDETSSKCSEADEDQLPQQKRTLLDNAKYVFRLCGWHIIATTIIPAIFKPIASFILEGYNIAALKENAKSDIVSHDAVLWFTSPALGSLRRMSREVSSKHSQTESIINGGGLMIRMFGVESHYMSRYTSDKDEEAKITQPTKSASLLSEMATISISFAGNFLTTCSAITQSHLTKHKASSGQLRLFQDDVDCMIHNVGRLVKIPSRLQRFSEDVGMFRQYADLEPEGPYIVEDCRVPGEWPSSGNVEFKNLSVKYGASLDYALKNLNFTARPGEKIGIVGRTGAGKSTLAKAIFRLLNKNVEGSIEIDGHDTAKFGVGDFRPKLGIIPQESAMFSGTVKRNLDPLYEFTIEDMWAAMIKCGVAELIDPNRKHKPARLTSQTSIASSNNNGNTAVESEIEDKEEDEEAKSIRLRWENSGLMMRVLLLLFAKRPEIEDSITPATGINKYLIQGGEGFSNGQKQLFSLCRVIMRKHKVLILDEATADVDQETDRKMQELIRSEFSNSTVLTIAHRLDTIMNSDRIIVMDKGEIVEMGPPQVLIANGGKFAELVQANEF
ncbi:Multidrug resistance-associated protein 1 [Coemansia sp. RSA 2337]|nr:Multidrug resistance-associated protein 1 [Coemansia sp. RSA 2337]